MQLRLFTFAALGMAAFGGLVSSGQSEQSNLALYGAPRHNLDSVLPVLSIEEQYIRAQTDGTSDTASGAAFALQCSSASPCPDGSCCNSQGQCGYRAEHCKMSCVANCDAKAPCGVNSKEGSQSCPLQFCCSHFGFCGASEFFCRDFTASGESTPCQKGFGKCGTVSTKTSPTCGKGSGTASRRVAYYEGWNTRRRPCDKVWPADIDTTGLTQLIFSFATIDPKTFAVGPMHPDDEKLYTEFLGLKDGSQKWIGIGGWEFSDPGATRHTWSQMTSTKANRQAFISSLLDFLEKWKFAGVDIDWEWPGAESRGGNSAIDKQNQVSLMGELRAALGSRSLSVVLPAQYEYLKNLDPKALEGSVDAFNVLAYDLHGPWDATIPGLSPFVKPHTDLNEIDAALELLWFTDVTPSKINLGIANYGRGYSLADNNCAHLNCTWTGPSKAGDCTELAGVLSQCEIKRAISRNNLKPQLIEGAGIKQIVFDGQWFGYDDSETLGLKIELANNRCLGGTALWAIDYASCTGGGPVGPGQPQHSSAEPLPSAPSASVAPPSASGVAPSAPSSGPPPPAPSSLTAPAASLTAAPSTSAVSSKPTSAAQSSAAQSSAAQSSVAASSASVITPSATSLIEPSAAPTTVASTAPPSQAESSAVASASSAVQQTSSRSLIISSSPDASSGGPPVVIVPTSGSLPSSAVTTASASGSSKSLLSSAATSQVASTRSSPPALVSSSLASESSASSSSTSLSRSSPASRTTPQTSPAVTSSDLTTIPASSTASASSVPSSAGLSSSGAGSTSYQTYSSIATTRTTPAPEISSATASFTSRPPSEQSSWGTSSAAQSSQTPTGTTSSSSSLSRFSTLSDATSNAGSQTSTTTPATISGAAPSSQPSSVSATSEASSAASWSVSSSVAEPSRTPSQTGVSSLRSQSMTLSTPESSTSSLWSTPVASSILTFSETQGSSTLTSSGPGSTSNQDRTSYTTDDNISIVTPSSIGTTTAGITSVGSAQPITTPANATSTSLPAQPNDVLSRLCSQCLEEDWCAPYATKMVSELPEFPPSECLDKGNEWCVDCWPKPPTYKQEMCPFQCWLSDWCKPLCTTPVDKLPDNMPPRGEKLPWFIVWWEELPVPGCVPNNCQAECHDWFGLSLALFKQPFCPCVPRTCTKGEKKENKNKKKCQLLGCGCGFMGLNVICDVKIKIDWKLIFPFGIFGPEPCVWFGGCLPKPKPGPPPPPPPAGEKKEWSDEGCGPLGCRGYCYDPEGKGCTPCPSELCGGPKCTRLGGCGPRTGPDPTPVPSRKPQPPDECDEKDKTTVTERIVSCFKDLKLKPTTVASINYTQTETLNTACITFEATISGCGVLGTSMTTTLTSLTTTRSSSDAPMCTRASLDLNNDEGDNPQPPRNSTKPEGPTCSRAPLSLDDDEGDNEHPEPEGPSCTRAPLSLDDDEGDNEHPEEGPSCTRAPLSLDDDEGDNSQPTSSEAPACTRAPLSLDDDEGNNEMPDDLSSSINGTISWNSSMPMTSRQPPPSTLSMSTAAPWGTGIPTGTPARQCAECDRHFNDCLKMRCPDGSDAIECAKFCLTAVCYDNDSPDYCKNGSCRPAACPKDPPRTYETAEPAIGFTTVMSLPSTTLTVTAFPTAGFVPRCPTCDLVFAECTKNACKQDGSDAERCAKRCLADLCYGDHKADLCKRGMCRPAACPNDAPRDFGTAEPAIPFTTVLSFPSTTITVSATPTFTQPTLTHSPTPRCESGLPISPNGKWTVLFEHKIQQRPDNATFKWDLWDEHGCPAGSGMSWNQYLGYNISAEIGAFERGHFEKMGYTLHTNVTNSLSTAESEIYFQISKPVADCMGMCHTEWKVNKRESDNSWQIFNDCAQQCSSPKLTPNDIDCETGVNKWQDNGDNPTSIRGGYCTFRMPFNPAKDDLPTSWTRGSKWTLDIIQTMEYEQSSLEWWAKDPNGINTTYALWDTTKIQRGPLVSEYIAGGVIQLPGANYDMYLMVRSPRTKDNSTIELTYLNQPWPDTFPCKIYTGVQEAYGTAMCQPSYRTETNDEKGQSLLDDCTEGQNFHCCNRRVTNMMPVMSARHTYCKTPVFKDNTEFSCEKVAHAFYPKDAGFERRFRCWWPHDFVDKYQKMDRDYAHGNGLIPEYLRYQTREWSVGNGAGSGLADVPGPITASGAFNETVGAFPAGSGENVSWTNATWR